MYLALTKFTTHDFSFKNVHDLNKKSGISPFFSFSQTKSIKNIRYIMYFNHKQNMTIKQWSLPI